MLSRIGLPVRCPPREQLPRWDPGHWHETYLWFFPASQRTFLPQIQICALLDSLQSCKCCPEMLRWPRIPFINCESSGNGRHLRGCPSCLLWRDILKNSPSAVSLFRGACTHIYTLLCAIQRVKGLMPREMAQWLRTLVALTEEPGSILSPQTAAHNCI